jgi:hypothetical protein
MNTFLQKDGCSVKDIVVDLADGQLLSLFLQKITNTKIDSEPNLSEKSRKINIEKALFFMCVNFLLTLVLIDWRLKITKNKGKLDGLPKGYLIPIS